MGVGWGLQLIGALWVEVKAAKHQMLIGCCYCPPSSTVDFWTKLEHCLELCRLRSQNSRVCLLGDFNVDISNPATAQFSHLHHFVRVCCLQNHIRSPTWIIAKTAITPDLLFTKESLRPLLTKLLCFSNRYQRPLPSILYNFRGESRSATSPSKITQKLCQL